MWDGLAGKLGEYRIFELVECCRVTCGLLRSESIRSNLFNGGVDEGIGRLMVVDPVCDLLYEGKPSARKSHRDVAPQERSSGVMPCLKRQTKTKVNNARLKGVAPQTDP